MKNDFNILLDPLPETWEGRRIDSDFQIGIQIFWILQDAELPYWEKIMTAGNLLFPEGKPKKPEKTEEAIMWFLTGWNTDNLPKGKAEKPVMDYQVDQWRIWVAFKKQYQIDLNREKVHFWEFMALLRNLEECSFLRVIDIRSKPLDSKMSREERMAYEKMKRTYALDSKQEEKKEYTEEEKKKIDAYDEMKRRAKAEKEAREAFERMKKGR